MTANQPLGLPLVEFFIKFGKVDALLTFKFIFGLKFKVLRNYF